MSRIGYQPGDLVEMKKGHPCGVNAWRILRVGADVKLKCGGCHHIVMLPRHRFDQALKKIIAEHDN